MSEVFYHIDQHGELEPGESMELEWPPRIKNDVVVKSSDSNENVLQEEYSDGLSRHGARYAQVALEAGGGIQLDEGWEAMSGVFDHVDIQQGRRGRHRIVPYQVVYEWMFETIRKAEFEDAHSRFQSYFAWESLEGAEQFRQQHRSGEGAIFKVRCEDYEIRDMDLIQTPHFGTAFENARRYWNCEYGSSSPTCEVVMEPPVEILEQL